MVSIFKLFWQRNAPVYEVLDMDPLLKTVQTRAFEYED